jgi:DNA repair protein RecO (recombination protein O)
VVALEELAGESEPRRASAYFLVAALDMLGYGPQLHACAHCDRPLPEAPAPFSVAHGGFLCVDCAEPEMIRVSVAALKVLRLMAAGQIDLYRRLKLEPRLLDELELVLQTQAEYHLDRRLKSLQFLRQMRSPA